MQSEEITNSDLAERILQLEIEIARLENHLSTERILSMEITLKEVKTTCEELLALSKQVLRNGLITHFDLDPDEKDLPF